MSNATQNVPAPSRDALAALARKATGGLISVADAAEALRVSSRAAVARLNRLTAAGWLSRVQRGLYLIVPIDASNAASTTVEDPWVLANALLAPCYIGGWSAAEHWQLTEQLFRSTFVVTAAGARTRAKTLLGAELHIVRVPRARVSGFAMVWRGPVRVAVSDRERTIVDALVAPDWVGGSRHLIEMLITYHQSTSFNPTKLLDRMNDVHKGAAYKRLGFLVERLFGPDDIIVPACLKNRTAGAIKLDPAIASRGKLVKRWGLWINTEVEPP
jgi:predicted transcriptional regulator of viral defense system